MGQRGPKPEPAALKLLRGNPGKRAVDLVEGVHPLVQIPPAPDWLNDEAAAEWARITPELEDLCLLAQIDLASLAMYCQTWGDLVQLERLFSAQRQAVLAKHPGRADLATLAIHFVQTPTGYKRPSPVYSRIIELRAEVDRLARSFGLNPSARMRVIPSQAQPAATDNGDQTPPKPGTPGNVVSFSNFK